VRYHMMRLLRLIHPLSVSVLRECVIEEYSGMFDKDASPWCKEVHP